MRAGAPFTRLPQKSNRYNVCKMYTDSVALLHGMRRMQGVPGRFFLCLHDFIKKFIIYYQKKHNSMKILYGDHLVFADSMKGTSKKYRTDSADYHEGGSYVQNR